MSNIKDSIKLEILQASYWEHYKYSQDMARYLSLNNHKRLEIEKELNIMLKEIHLLQNR
jgi:hypothetical protein